MSNQVVFERTLASLHDAMLDDTHWAATSALIDEACGLWGNALAVGDRPEEDIWLNIVGIYSLGERRTDLEREYLEVYKPKDERVLRQRQLPASRLTPTRDLYTAIHNSREPALVFITHSIYQVHSCITGFAAAICVTLFGRKKHMVRFAVVIRPNPLPVTTPPRSSAGVRQAHAVGTDSPHPVLAQNTSQDPRCSHHETRGWSPC